VEVTGVVEIEEAEQSKSTNSTKPKGNGTAASRDGNAPTSSKKAVGTPPAFSPHDIGNVAGEIWGLLTNNGEQTLAGIKKSVDAPSDIVLAAIGWLAREDKLEFSTSGRTVKISLR
jgi:hypothetical protein